jgi:D-alanyl-D-alanine dipeptidase
VNAAAAYSLTRLVLAFAVPVATLVVLMILVATLALGSQQSGAAQLGELPGQVADIPPEYLTLYASAGKRFKIDWAVVAAIGKIETNHGRSTLPGVSSGVNAYGCCAGPMQFYIVGSNSTWKAYGRDDNRDGRIDVYDPGDAVPAAARYLRASGAPKDYRRAIFAYNHSQAYVDQVLRQAAMYRSLATTPEASSSVWQLVSNPRITLSPVQRQDLANGLIDPRVVGLLNWSLARHTLYISSLRSDHSLTTSNGSRSNHSYGRAVDIAIVDGQSCTGTRSGRCGALAIEWARLRGSLHSTELIYCFDPDSASPDAWAAADHCDHVHAGYDR